MTSNDKSANIAISANLNEKIWRLFAKIHKEMCKVLTRKI